MKNISIPPFCCELVYNSVHSGKAFKVCRNVIENEPRKNEPISIFMEGTGYTYRGEIYHKTCDYIYIYLY